MYPGGNQFPDLSLALPEGRILCQETFALSRGVTSLSHDFSDNASAPVIMQMLFLRHPNDVPAFERIY